MHTLSRQVRFSITPFVPSQPDGYNSYASKPTGAGLSFYLSLWVELEGIVDPETGFIVNVSDIDKIIRKYAVGAFVSRINASMEKKKPLFLTDLSEVLCLLTPSLRSLFQKKHGKTLKKLRLELNPYRSIECGDTPAKEHGKTTMFTYSEKFEFSAMHKLWNDKFNEKKNLDTFGKCANPTGHGHNYILEVAVQVPIAGLSEMQDETNKEPENWIADFQRIVKVDFLDIVDHKNLNSDVAAFQTLNPTVENIALLAWKSLKGRFGTANLSRITVWENDRTYCTYSESFD